MRWVVLRVEPWLRHSSVCPWMVAQCMQPTASHKQPLNYSLPLKRTAGSIIVLPSSRPHSLALMSRQGQNAKRRRKATTRSSLCPLVPLLQAGRAAGSPTFMPHTAMCRTVSIQTSLFESLATSKSDVIQNYLQQSLPCVSAHSALDLRPVHLGECCKLLTLSSSC